MQNIYDFLLKTSHKNKAKLCVMIRAQRIKVGDSNPEQPIREWTCEATPFKVIYIEKHHLSFLTKTKSAVISEVSVFECLKLQN